MPFDLTLRHEQYAPRPVADFHSGGHFPRLDVHERHVVRWAVGREDCLAVSRHVDAPRPFADLVRSDGYELRVTQQSLAAEALQGISVLVIVLARGANDANDDDAFTGSETAAIDAWVRGGDDPRFCRVRVEAIGESRELEVNLRRGVNVQAPTNLQVKARRVLQAGKPIVIGQLSRPDGRTVEVRAKLR